MIHDGLKVIFIHIPRTAGNSIKYALREHPGYLPEDGHNHQDLKWHSQKYPKRIKEYFKFICIRNPFDMLYSHFMFKRVQNREEARLNDFNKWIERYHADKKYQYGICFTPQIDFMLVDGKMGIDVIIHYEKLAEEWEIIQERLKINTPLKHLYSSCKDDFKNAYTDKSIEIMQKVFAKDFNNFGYKNTP